MSTIERHPNPNEHPTWRALSNFPARTVLTQRDFFPGGTGIAVIEEMREEHHRLIDLRDEKNRALTDLFEAFEAEQEARQDELNAAAREGRPEQLPPLTPKSEREEALAEAEARMSAATRAVLSHALAALDRLQGRVPDEWEYADAQNTLRVPPDGEAAVILGDFDAMRQAAEREANEAAARAAEAERKVRVLQPLRHWLVTNANLGAGSKPPLSAAVLYPDEPHWSQGSKPEYIDARERIEEYRAAEVEERSRVSSAPSVPVNVERGRAELEAHLAAADAEHDVNIKNKEL